jgi:tRNA threonylcarbamoyladenosine biosynthesis protein TsaE
MSEPVLMHLVLELRTPAETEGLGRTLGRDLAGGSVIALEGPLGAGKTLLAKGVAVGNGLRDASLVTSPTFTLVQEYAGRLHLYHLDVYRLKSAAEVTALGFSEMIRPDAAVLIEWADRISELLPDDRLTIRLEPTGAEQRHAELIATGPLSRQCLARLQCALD